MNRSFPIPFHWAAVAGAACIAAGAQAQSLHVVTDVVGGSPNGNPNGCTTYGPLPTLQAFFGGGGFQAAGGNAACGYTGLTTDRTAAGGVLTTSQSLGPVGLDTGGSFSGQVAARSSFGSIGVEARGNLVGDAINTSATSSAAAALFDDVFTATGSTGTGYVRYLFGLDGTLTVPAQQVAYHPGSAAVLFNYQHDGGVIYGAAGLRADTASVGYSYAAIPVTNNWTVGIGSVTGSGTFASGLEAIQFGVPWELQVGMLAQTIGEGYTGFLGTGRIVGFEFYDAARNRLDGVQFSSASGVDYLAPIAPVPEPETWVLIVFGLAGVAAIRRRATSPERRGS